MVRTLLLSAIVFGVLLLCTNNVVRSQGQETCGPEEINEIKNIVHSEELILALTPRLKALNRAALNLKIPSGNAGALFLENAKCNSLAQQVLNANEDIESFGAFELLNLPAEDGGNHAVKEEGIWSEVLPHVSYLDRAKFYFIDAEFTNGMNQLDATMGFKAKGSAANRTYSFKAKIKSTWKRINDNAGWKIATWKTEQFRSSSIENTLFDEITSQIIDQPLRNELSRSRHEEITLNLIQGKSVKRRDDDTYPFFFPEVTLEHPAVSIVDIDQDGCDDFFLARPHLPSLMFRNRGDGTFEEIGESIGLRIPYDCTCSLFADFDNDGDRDVFIGRARYRARYFENRKGNFVDRTSSVFAGKLPYMTSSLSAADYNNDGLLDIYFSTYSPIEGSHGIIRDGESLVWPKQFLSTYEKNEFEQRKAKSTAFIDVTGPPNLLLKNEGGIFSVADSSKQVASWRKTFQAMWWDFDNDGDQDLYVCNDFAPDDLYRNDSAGGFSRVNEEVGLDQLGFGMGVASEDHDRDGDLDLYISNMFSKAGTRITRQVSEINPQLSQMAAGNFLYDSQGDRFRFASGTTDTNAAVAVTGWSWGGRLVDIDNSGEHEIFVANGYYSAPDEVAEQTDL